ncbi:hypothetical protein E2C01_090121 [Portunus trituberculatus]|uniref:Uncharacterized protein n=1 Tax=Portunus trituberculatus TaxID=210409 RepID=A0A5B7JDU8_PORTR|nr:hypothetical protein [Portunus trituberculatus]
MAGAAPRSATTYYLVRTSIIVANRATLTNWIVCYLLGMTALCQAQRCNNGTEYYCHLVLARRRHLSHGQQCTEWRRQLVRHVTIKLTTKR